MSLGAYVARGVGVLTFSHPCATGTVDCEVSLSRLSATANSFAASAFSRISGAAKTFRQAPRLLLGLLARILTWTRRPFMVNPQDASPHSEKRSSVPLSPPAQPRDGEIKNRDVRSSLVGVL